MDVMTGYEVGMMCITAFVIVAILLVSTQVVSSYIIKRFPPLG
jgi:hypothetical protein